MFTIFADGGRVWHGVCHGSIKSGVGRQPIGARLGAMTGKSATGKWPRFNSKGRTIRGRKRVQWEIQSPNVECRKKGPSDRKMKGRKMSWLKSQVQMTNDKISPNDE